MKRLNANSLAVAVAAVIFVPALALAQTATPPSAKQKPREEVNKVRAEMDAGGRHYREGNFEQAVAHFRKVIELDPEHKTAPLFLARSLQEQFKPGDTSQENLAKGEEAVEAYRQLLAKAPLNDEPFNTIVNLYRQMGNEEKARATQLERAGDANLPPAKRAGIYARMLGEDWQCAYDITEKKDNKETVQQADKVTITYKMPADSSEFYKARQCVTRGLEVAEYALQLSPQNARAWSHKANLFRESAKLAEMEGDASQKEAAEGQYKDAMAEHQRLSGGNPRMKEVVGVYPGTATPGDASDKPVTSDPNAPPTGKGAKAPIAAGILNGKAVSKPAPAYPQAAKDSGVSGTVTVQVTIDEEGNVIAAVAISGHALLREAAEAAARQARFSPTQLSGQPVKVTGLVTYNFVLE